MARTFGAPGERPGREAGRHGVQCGAAVGQHAGDGGDQVHDVAVALDVAVVLDAHGAGDAHPAQIVAAQIDQHQVLRAFLLVGQQLLLEQLILLLGGAAPSGTGDRVRGGPAVLHGDQRLRTGADDRKRRLPSIIGNIEQIHVRARLDTRSIR
jgi:hypothetical protein